MSLPHTHLQDGECKGASLARPGLREADDVLAWSRRQADRGVSIHNSLRTCQRQRYRLRLNLRGRLPAQRCARVRQLYAHTERLKGSGSHRLVSLPRS